MGQPDREKNKEPSNFRVHFSKVATCARARAGRGRRPILSDPMHGARTGLFYGCPDSGGLLHSVACVQYSTRLPYERKSAFHVLEDGNESGAWLESRSTNLSKKSPSLLSLPPFHSFGSVVGRKEERVRPPHSAPIALSLSRSIQLPL